jgi:RNA polymerase sigma factor (sigma-70 family)
MPGAGVARALRELRRTVLLHDGGGLSDAELLDAFLLRRDEPAFEALLRRHGPMVLGVCRRLLGSPHDAADAFQAVFLVLVRKADSIRARAALGAWLYGVAYRTSLKARARAQRRRAREAVAALRREEAGEPAVPSDDLLAVLDEEVSALPEKYRALVVQCELQARAGRAARRRRRSNSPKAPCRAGWPRPAGCCASGWPGVASSCQRAPWPPWRHRPRRLCPVRWSALPSGPRQGPAPSACWPLPKAC